VNTEANTDRLTRRRGRNYVAGSPRNFGRET
jgi:hypothetical protein